jgi:hypothetical protein
MPRAVLDVVPPAVLTELVSGLAGTMAVVTGIFARSARAWAVLREMPPDRIEWVTAIGFAFGAVVTILIVCLDLFWEQA